MGSWDRFRHRRLLCHLPRLKMEKTISRLDHQLPRIQLNRYWLSVCALTKSHIGLRTSLSFREMYRQVKDKLGEDLAAEFTHHILKNRSNWGDVNDLDSFIRPNFEFDREYPEVNLCLTVADYFNIMDEEEYRTIRSFISIKCLSNQNVAEYQAIDFVRLLFASEHISPGNVSKVEHEYKYHNYFNEYKAKFKELFPDGFRVVQPQPERSTSFVEVSNTIIPIVTPDGPSGAPLLTEQTFNSSTSSLSQVTPSTTTTTTNDISEITLEVRRSPSPTTVRFVLPVTTLPPSVAPIPMPLPTRVTTPFSTTIIPNDTHCNEASVDFVSVGDDIKFNPIDILGEESNNTFRGYFKDQPAAVKRVPIHTKLTKNEKEILLNCPKHENIVDYYNIFTDHSFSYFVLQLCDGSLLQFVEGNNPYNLDVDTKSIIRDIFSGIDHLHRHNIIHRDIKPGNILLTKRKGSPFVIIAVLCDFGISRKLKTGKHAATTTYRRGSNFWLAPEMLSGALPDCCTKAIDYFGAGCVLYYFLSNGLHPFGVDVEIPNSIMNYNCDIKDLNIEDWMTAKHLIEMLIAKEPNSRCSAEEALSHCYFWSRDRQASFFEAVCDWMTNTAYKDSTVMENIEGNVADVFDTNWMNRLDASLQQELICTHRHEETTLKGLLLAVKQMKLKSSSTIDFLIHFTKSFPSLLVHLYKKIKPYSTTDQVLCEFYPGVSYDEGHPSTGAHDGLPPYNTGTLPTVAPPTNNGLPGDMTTLPFIESVTRDFEYNESHDLGQIYKMNTNPRGYCVIINIRKNRAGTDEDAKSLDKLFTHLKFKVLVYDDLSKSDIQKLAKLVQDTDHVQLSCFLMFILAHGDTLNGESVILAADDQYVNVSEIVECIKNGKGLIGKPKLLFIQACRGGQTDYGIESNEEYDNTENEECDIIIATDSDFFIANATTKGHPAARNNVTGAIFIQHLIAILMQHAEKYNLHDLMTKVKRSVSTRDQGKVIITRQAPETTCTLVKTFYFGMPPLGIKSRKTDTENKGNEFRGIENHSSTYSDPGGLPPYNTVTPPTVAPPTNNDLPDISLIVKKKPGFSHLFGKLRSIQKKWEVLKLLLRVTIIEEQNNDDVNLSRVLDAWLGTEEHKATWEYLFFILEDILEEYSAANELKIHLQNESIFEKYINS